MADPITELENRLHRLDSHLATVADHFRGARVLLPDDEHDLERLRARSSALRLKIGDARAGLAAPSAASLEAEWRALGTALQRWADRIDQEYRHG
jgi:hypothetical protein